MPTLSSSFDLYNAEIHNEAVGSGVTSVLSGPDDDGFYTVTDQVFNGTEGIYSFSWPTPLAWTQMVGRSDPPVAEDWAGDAVRTLIWTSLSLPVASTGQAIVFTPEGFADDSWGGSHSANKYKPAASPAAAQVNKVLSATFGYTSSGTTTFLSSITLDESGYYYYEYRIENDSRHSFNFAWAGFVGSVCHHSTWRKVIRSLTLAGTEVFGTASILHPEAGINCVEGLAPYWTVPPIPDMEVL